MDKLKPILANKFWILCGLALLLPPSGWFLGARQLVNESTKRKGELEGKFGKAKISGAVPNQTWAKAVKKRTAVQEKYFRAAAAKLWNTQKRQMVWPRTVASLMANAEYRKPAADQVTAGNNFRSAYYAYLRNIWKIVDPVNYPSPAGRPVSQAHIGKVVLEWETIPKVPEGTWQELPPTSEEMWDAMEDVWLVTAILQSIANVNKDATNIADASVREISTLELMGGSRNEGGDDGGGDAAADMAGMADMPAMPASGYTSGAGMRGGSAMPQGVGGSGASLDFSPEEEFGPATATAPSTGSAMDASDAMNADASGGGGGVLPTMGMGMQGVASRERRYIDDDPDLPFKTRGFYIKVLMDHRRLPELVAALTNSPFPVEIVRIHQQDAHPSSSGGVIGTPGAASGAMPVGSGAGRPFGNRSAGGGSVRAMNSGSRSPFARGGLGLRLGKRSARQPVTRRAGSRRSTAGMGMTDQTQMDPEARQTVGKALADPELSYVVLQGLMTLYLPPGFDQQASAADSSSAGRASTPSSTLPATGAAKSKPKKPPLPAASPSATKSASSATGSKSKQAPKSTRPPVPGQPAVPGEAVKPGAPAGAPPKPASALPPDAGAKPSGNSGRVPQKSSSAESKPMPKPDGKGRPKKADLPK